MTKKQIKKFFTNKYVIDLIFTGRWNEMVRIYNEYLEKEQMYFIRNK